MPFSLLVDNRERKLLDLLSEDDFFNSQHMKIMPLEVGDIQVKDDDIDVPKVVIERKTIADLAASIKDGRYKEQKMRLKQLRTLNPNMILLYIVEGRLPIDDDSHIFGLSSKAMNSFIYNTMFRDHINVITSQSLLHTFNIITGIYKRLATSSDNLWGSQSGVEMNHGHGPTQEAYTEALIKTRRKDNVDVATCFMMQLCAVPGISHSKAKLLIDALNVSTMLSLMDTLKASQDPEKTLLSVKGIGKSLAHALLQNLGLKN